MFQVHQPGNVRDPKNQSHCQKEREEEPGFGPRVDHEGGRDVTTRCRLVENVGEGLFKRGVRNHFF